MQELIYPDYRVRRPGFLTDGHARIWDVSTKLGCSKCINLLTTILLVVAYRSVTLWP
jgi:hypothetical protein